MFKLHLQIPISPPPRLTLCSPVGSLPSVPLVFRLHTRSPFLFAFQPFSLSSGYEISLSGLRCPTFPFILFYLTFSSSFHLQRSHGWFPTPPLSGLWCCVCQAFLSWGGRFPEDWSGTWPGRGGRLRKASFSLPTVGHTLTMLPAVAKENKTQGPPLENYFGGNLTHFFSGKLFFFSLFLQ